MDVRDIFPDLKVFTLLNDDSVFIRLRFDPPNNKEATFIIKFRIPRIDEAWPYDEFMSYDFSDEIWMSVEQKGSNSFAITLDELKEALTLLIQEIENAYQDRDISQGWTIHPVEGQDM